MDMKYLNYPLYMLYYVDDVTQFSGLNENQLATLAKEEPHINSAIKDAIRWAIEHPEFDFQEFDDTLPHSNEDIYDFLCKVGRSLGLSDKP